MPANLTSLPAFRLLSMTEQELLDEALRLAEARDHRLTPFVRREHSFDSRCATCARQVYVTTDPGLTRAAMGAMPSLKPVSGNRMSASEAALKRKLRDADKNNPLLWGLMSSPCQP
jgi:hypothetical protein